MNTVRRTILACWFILGLCLAPPAGAGPVPVGNRIYVDIQAAGANNGSSWADAYTSLQDALAASVSGDEVWVADGVYYPDVGAGLADNDRSLSFVIKEGVKVYGGFDGGETSLAARAWQTHRAILSGDLAQDDTTDGAGLVLSYTDQAGSNAYSVVRFANTTNAAVLDGFYVTAGAAVGDGCPSENGCGGDILVQSDSDTAGPAISNLVVSGCSAAAVGGGMAVWRAAALRLSNITLAGNHADTGGGLSLVYRGKAVIEGASIITNSALFAGGIEVDNSSQLHLSGASVAGNVSANNGGGLYLHYNTTTGAAPTAVLTDVLFLNNTASSTTGGGGGIADTAAGCTSPTALIAAPASCSTG